MAVVREKMRWRGTPFGVTSAWGTTDLLLGEFGRGERGVLITAGIHGDEGPWGGWAINKLLQSIDESDVDGLIRVVPLSNPLAMQADKRNAPVDQLDLNRVFPGDPTGSYTERVAHILATAALENIDYVVDLHGGGSWCVNAFVFEMDGGRDLSLCFPAPFIVNAPTRDVSLTGYARALGNDGDGGGNGWSQPMRRALGGQYRRGIAARFVHGRHRQSTIGAAANHHRLFLLPVSRFCALIPAGYLCPPWTSQTSAQLPSREGCWDRCCIPATYAVQEEFRAPYPRDGASATAPLCRAVGSGRDDICRFATCCGRE